MTSRAFPSSLALALALLGTAIPAPPVSADPPEIVERKGYMLPSRACPAATHALQTCPDFVPQAFVVFDRGRGRMGHISGWVTLRGELDLVSCAPYPLLHVRRAHDDDSIPPPPCP